MSQAGFTPIQLYFSTTAAATPSAGNLANGELAVNITDGKLFYKDNGGVVKVLATAGSLAGPGSSTDNALVRFDGTTGALVQSSVGVLSDAGVLTGLTGLTSSGPVTFSSLNPGRVPYATTAGLLTDSANLTFNGTTLTTASLTSSGPVTFSSLTSGRIPYATTAGLLTDSANLTFNGTTLTTVNAASFAGVTVGKGGGSVIGNTSIGQSALQANTTGSENTAVGFFTLFGNTTGVGNVAVGSSALQANTTGSSNTAMGRQALQANTTGANNAAIGQSALQLNTTGVGNVAVGSRALESNTTGSINTAIGQSALQLNTTGGSNTAIGTSALQANTTGSESTAIGTSALQANTTGFANTAIGLSALQANTTGVANTAIGRQALSANTAGIGNVAVGVRALYVNTTGGGNTAINPFSSAGAYTPVFDPTTENNRFCAGSTAVTNAYIQVAWTVVSDQRDKTDFAPVPHGLDFVNKLKPTAYRYKVDREASEGHGPVRYGFKAQDVLALEGGSPVIVDAEDLEKLRFNDQALIAVLVNAVQELSAKVKILENK